MKKFCTALAAAALMSVSFSAAAFASPLQNYDTGRFSVDAGISLPSSIDGNNYKLSKSNSSYLGATVGIGSNTALNYRWNNYKAHQARTRAQQFNLMYKLLPGISAYGGYLNTDTSSRYGRTENSGQVGLQASYNIPLLFTVWGNIGVGSKNSGYEIGISKPILNNVELNASYYHQKFKDAFDGGSDLKAKGVNLGVTVKF